MKILIDRCLGFYQKLAGKRFYFIVTAAEPRHEAADETIAGLRGLLRCIPNAQECGILYGTGTWDKGDVYRHPAYERAYQAGKEEDEQLACTPTEELLSLPMLQPENIRDTLHAYQIAASGST